MYIYSQNANCPILASHQNSKEMKDFKTKKKELKYADNTHACSVCRS